MPEQMLTQEAIQGRLGQREVPWLATVSPTDNIVTFKPKDGGHVYVGWDQSQQAPTFDQIVDLLASYRG